MIDWIDNLVENSASGGGPPAQPPPELDPELLALLRHELRECETLYRLAAAEALRDAPERCGDPQQFKEQMLDLHRGLLVKVFMEIAEGDRHWSAAERFMAQELLLHVWGTEVVPKQLPGVLEHVANYAEVLKWESLVGPFLRLECLKHHLPALATAVVRIANLIAKADGKVRPSESAALRSIQRALENAFEGKTEAESEGIFFDDAPKKVKEAIQSESAGKKDDKDADPPAGLEQTPQEAYDEALAELNDLIGLETVKHDIRELASFLRVQRAREQHDLPATDVSLHSIFQGNPGTGKTTVARILGRVLYGLELLEKGHTVEVDRSGFVAEYVGQTAPKSHKLVDSALGGVLFVDEAYSLVIERGEDPFGREAVQVLLKRIEDDRDRFVAILAGYPVPMQRLIQTNPGLSSRFQRTFAFPDFTADELVQIFDLFCERNQYVLSEPARDKLTSGFQWSIDRKDQHFGNARLARNIFEKAIRRLAMRIADIAPLTRELLTTLEADDLEIETIANDAGARST